MFLAPVEFSGRRMMSMIRLAGTLGSLLILLLVAVPGQASTLGPKIDTIVKAKIASGGPGAVVTVLEDGKVIHQAAYGFADVPKKAPLTIDSAIDLASVSKAFTSYAVLLLVQRGQLHLDDDVRKILPELSNSNYPRAIRLHHLLHMTAGLPGYEDQFESLGPVTNTDVVKKLGKTKAADRPGHAYSYSNSAYSLLGLIIERTSRDTLAHFLQKEIFGPLGMKNTVLVDHNGQVVPGRAKGYQKKGKGWAFAKNDTGCVGDGQIFSSATDMTHWWHELAKPTLIDRKRLEWCFTTGKLDSGKTTDYGAGWVPGNYFGHDGVHHSGSWDGTSAYISLYRDTGVGVIILSNIYHLDPSTLAGKIERVVLKAHDRK
jgi:CubicO group peptidase (beta-lactamase class C family)